MPLINQGVPHFLQGVSQEPPFLRDLSRVSEQKNGFSSRAAGLGKRPGSTHIAKIIADTADSYDSAAVFVLSEGLDERYAVIALSGDLKVLDLETGVLETVSFPDGKGYLSLAGGTDEVRTDEFAGSNGDNLNGRVSGPFTWARKYISSGTTDPIQIESNKAEQTNSGGISSKYAPGVIPGAADYSVECAGQEIAVGGTNYIELGLRVDTSTGSGYYMRISGSATAPVVKILERTTWTAESTLGSVTLAFASTDSHLYEFACVGSILTCYVDGVSVLSKTDTTYTAAGSPILGFGPGSTLNRRWKVDNFTVSWTGAHTASPSDYQLITVGPTSYLLNKTVTVAQGTDTSPTRNPEALIVITQADYGTKYELTLNGIIVSHTTPLGTDATIRDAISTDFIASQIKAEIEALDALDDFTIDRYGSTLHIYRSDEADFTISATDGLADNGLTTVKGSIQHFSDLPLRAPSGFVVHVTGDPTTDIDDFWVKFDDSDTSGVVGVWKECAKPGSVISLDASTMPHRLFKKGDLYHGLINTGLASLPVVSPYGSDETAENISKAVDGSASTNDNGLAEKFTTEADITEADCVFSSLSQLNGGPCTVTINYDLITSGLAIGKVATVTVWKGGTSGTYASRTWTSVATKEYPAGLALADESLSWVTTTEAADTDIRIALLVDSTDDVDFPLIGPQFTVHAKNDTFPGVTVARSLGQKINWNPSTKYPSGMKFTVAVGATDTFNYTTTGDETGAEVATGVKALVDADSDWVAANDESGEVEITPASGSATFTVTVTNDFDPDTVFFESDASFTVDDLIGKTLKNLTDGSEGTITDNTATTITVDALTGGSKNTFTPGDECSIPSAGFGFTFAQENWDDREAGDVFSNPNPSFVNDKLNAIFAHRGRLGLLTGSTVALSAAGEPTRWFRKSVTQILDNDPIDIADSSRSRRQFHDAVEWGNNLILWTDETQSILTGDNLLTPKSVRLQPLTAYKNSSGCRPLAVGDSILYARDKKVFALRVSPDTQQAVQQDLMVHCPTYIASAPTSFAADEALGVSLVRSGLDDTLYVLFYADERNWKQQAWSQWNFAGDVLGHAVYDGTLYMVMKYADGLHLETLDLRAGNGT